MKYLFVFCLIISSLPIGAQADVWQIYQMSSLFDLGSVVHPTSYGYAVFGNISGSANNSGDIFFLRLDADGNEIDRDIIGTPNRREMIDKGVLQMPDGGWLLAGWQRHLFDEGYLVRLDANGQVVWSKTLTNAANQGFAFRDIAQLPSGDFIATGSNAGVLKLMRLTQNGDVVWSNTYNEDDDGRKIYISQAGGNCFVIDRYAVYKFRTSNGQLIWKKTMDTPPFGVLSNSSYFTNFQDIKSLGNGLFAIVGDAISDNIFNFELAPHVSMWNEQGELHWSEVFYSDHTASLGMSTGNSLLYLPNEAEILIAGEADNGVGVIRIDMQGIRLNDYEIASDFLCVSPVLGKRNGRYFLAGGVFNDGMNTLFYRSGNNWLPDGDLRPEGRLMPHQTLVSACLYPNPATSIIQLAFEADEGSESTLFQIRNMQGDIAWSTKYDVFQGRNVLDIDVTSLPKGIYVICARGLNLSAQKWVKE